MTVNICAESNITLGSLVKDEIHNTVIVVQGPYHGEITSWVIQNMCERNNNILFVLATYLPEDEKSGKNSIGTFLCPFEKELITQGKLVCVFVDVPSKEKFPEFWQTNIMNQNLQRLTSYAGFKYAHDNGFKFGLKIRSDFFFLKENVLEHFKESLLKFPPLDKKMNKRICVGSHGTFNRDDLPHICDFWYFGHVADLLRFLIFEKDHCGKMEREWE
jgi:hypothetical protein